MGIESLALEINKPTKDIATDWLLTLLQLWWKIAISKFVFYIISMIINNLGLVDFAYVFNQWLIGILLFQQSLQEGYDIKTFLIFIGLTLWFFRLGGMIFFKRIIPNAKDARYEQMLEKRNKYVFGFIQFQFQGFLIMFTSSSLYFAFRMAHYDNTIPWIIGIIIVFIGVIGEGVADAQLDRFRAKGIRGAIMHEGLWRYSRHPNLFFELVTWTGFAIAGYHNNGIECLGFISIVILWAIMKYLTIPITEEYMKQSRPVTFPEFCKRSNEFLIFRCKKDPPLSQEMIEAFKGGEAAKKINGGGKNGQQADKNENTGADTDSQGESKMQKKKTSEEKLIAELQSDEKVKQQQEVKINIKQSPPKNSKDEGNSF